MFRRLLTYLARNIIEGERRVAYTMGGADGHSRGYADAQSANELAATEVYLDGITAGVALTLQKPGEYPRMWHAPEGITLRMFFRAIDKGEVVAAGFDKVEDEDTPADVEGIKLRADQLRKLREGSGFPPKNWDEG